MSGAAYRKGKQSHECDLPEPAILCHARPELPCKPAFQPELTLQNHLPNTYFLNIFPYHFMKKNFISFAFGALFLSAGLFLTGCTSEDETVEKPATSENGVFVTNEGQYTKGNGAVSFISKQTSKVDRDLFMTVNNRPLGDIVQSMTIHNGKAYIVVNNSEKIEIADANTFKEGGVINGLVLPRYAVGLNNKLYVTEYVAFGKAGRV